MATSRSLGGRSVTLRSPMKISPMVTSSKPARRRRMVDFPHPEGPTRTMNSPSPISRETSSTATTSDPNSLVTPSSTIPAMSRSLLSRGPAPRSVRPESLVRQGGPGSAQGPPARSQPLQPEHRRTQHGRFVEHGDPSGRGHGPHALLDLVEEGPLARPEDPAAQHH